MKAIFAKKCQLLQLKQFLFKLDNNHISLGSQFIYKQKIKEKIKLEDDHTKITDDATNPKQINLTNTLNLNKNETNSLKQIDSKQLLSENYEVSLLDNSWNNMKLDMKQLPHYYLKLAKRNLTALVVITTMGGYAMAPAVFDPLTFLYVSVGTALTSTSANAINQFLEVPYDSQMNRTKDRVLVRGRLTQLHAFTFASVCGLTGVSLLYYYVNPLTAALGLTNLFLYTSVYTPLKRLSVLNTWVGSFVGAIPPIMGYTACTGQIDAAGLLLGAILYSWQFPHFHALSWNLRNEYSRAGYRMISTLNSRVCTSSSLNHTIALTVMCSYLAPVIELTTWNFAIDSLGPNLYFMYLAYKFKRDKDSNSSRKLFRYSLIYLPLVMLLMLVTKKPASEIDRKNSETKKLQEALLRASLLSQNNNKI